MWEGRRWNRILMFLFRGARTALPAATWTFAKVGGFLSKLEDACKILCCTAVKTNTTCASCLVFCFLLLDTPYRQKANGIHLQISATDPGLMRGRETVSCTLRCGLCVQTCKQGSDCTTCETEHPVRASVCMWSACGRLSVAMEILGKAFLQKEAGEQLSPPLGDSYALAQILLQDFHSSHFTHVPPPRLPAFAPFIFFPVCIH